MKGLAVVDGDLVLAGGDFLTFTGPTRIKQDLSFALHDDYGANSLHPYWGSILDRLVGQPLTPALQQQVINEVRRVIDNYIRVQADMVNQSVINGVKGSLDTSDIVRNVGAIDVKISMDSISITVELQTMANDSVTLTRTVGV